MIEDSFGRKHTYLRISLTERCNLRCFYCMPEEGIPLRSRAEFMTKDEVITLARTFVDMGVTKIRLTGGEPLVRKDAAEIISELGKLPVKLAITTNAVLVDQFIEVFQNAGLKDINVSLDSLDTSKIDKITRRNYGSRIMENIKLLVRSGFNVKINAVLIKGTNDNEIADFIALTRQLPVQVRFIEFMPFDGNAWDWSKGVAADQILQTAADQFGSGNLLRLMDQPNDTARNYQISGFAGSFANISSVSNPFCDTCNRIRLTADGKIKNCLFSGEETDLLTPLRNGEPVVPHILDCFWKKAYKGAGYEKLSGKIGSGLNRTMVAIGG